MSDLPPPMTPAECDLRGFMEWSRFFGEKAFRSHWYRASLKDPRGGIAALKLWWEAMLQCPAGSLPNDEEELCWLADFGQDIRTWRKHRPTAMHGFVLCADNRWYHPFLAEEAMDAWARRRNKDRMRDQTAERTRHWRERKSNGDALNVTRHKPNGDASRDADVTQSVTSRARQDSTRQERPPRSPPVTGGDRGAVRKFRNAFHLVDGGRASPIIDASAEDLADFQGFVSGRRAISDA